MTSKKQSEKASSEIKSKTVPVNGADMSGNHFPYFDMKYADPKYFNLIESSNDGIVVLQDGVLKFTNSVMLRMCGYTMDDVLNNPFLQHVTPEFQKIVMERHTSRIRGESVIEKYEAALIASDGHVIPVELNSSEITYEGKPAVLTMIRDITENKAMELALKKSEEKYASLIKKTTDGFLVIQDHVIKYANPAVLEMFDSTADRVLGSSYVQYIAPEYNQILAERYQRLMDNGQSVEKLECELIAVDSRRIWVELNSTPFEYDDKPAILTSIRDLTERRNIEADLSLKLQLLDKAFVSIIVSDEEGNIVYANNEACSSRGYSKDEMIKMNIVNLVPEGSKEIVRKYKDEVIVKNKRVIELEIKRKDGTKFPVEMEASTIDINGKKLIVGISRDITRQKNEEAKRKELEQKAQISNRLTAVGEMAAGIAHEINNPLTAVVGYSELLLNENISAEMRTDLEIIHEGGKRAASIVEGLLAFARQRKPQRRKVQINDILKTTLDLQAYALKTNNISVITHYDPDLPVTIADANQMQQVFLNLIINAQAEMKKTASKGTLEITTENVDDLIRISFKDSGSGIARENLERIFDPFFTTKGVGEGTGLGLSISHGIISEHNGRIYVRSHKGSGATFVIEIPVIAKSEQLAFEETEMEVQTPGKARILVVDDESVIRALVSRVLRSEGHDIDVVDSGEKALEMISEKKYDLILLDIKMPGIGGIELYKRINEIDSSFINRIMFITGDVMGDETQKFLLKTKAPYIMKPFDSAKLKIEINRLLEN